MTSPLEADLLRILTGTRHLLLDFDGPICDIYAGLPAHDVAARLRKLIPAGSGEVPEEIASSADPLRVFAWAASVDAELGAHVEAEMTKLECAAVVTARPTPYLHELVTSARESGRSASVASNNSEQAVRAYLAQQGLDDRIELIVARTSHDATLLKPSPHLIQQALMMLNARPGQVAFIGDSDTDIHAAGLAGVPVIGYANRPGKRAALTNAGAGAVVDSLADVTLVLRACPAPP